MRLSLLKILACPACQDELSLRDPSLDENGEVRSGTLDCPHCDASYPVERGIPRFVDRHPADASFGYQWNTFRRVQLDSATGTGLSARRLLAETGWSAKDLEGMLILDVGCGAGRFLDVVSSFRCEVVGVDVTSAIDAAAATVRERSNVHLIQADVYNLPFRSGVFDACYCIGVAQHTPDPERALGSLPRCLKPGGRVAVTVYERKRWTRLNGKYLLRPITRRMNKRLLMAMIRGTMPVLFPVTDLLFRLPIAGRVFEFAIPVANYVDLRWLTRQQRYRLALLDTFDRLAPEYDAPLTEAEVHGALHKENIGELRRLRNPGVNMVGRRQDEALSWQRSERT